MTADHPPLIVAEHEAMLPSLRAELAAQGWVLRDGWPSSHSWRTGAQRTVCVGTVESPGDREAALIACLTAGTGLLTVLPKSQPESFLEDLGRIGRVERRSGSVDAHPRLTPLQTRLLESMAEGATIAGAAEGAFVSLRTAYRELAQARSALGVRKNREALVAVARWRRQDG